MDNMDMNTALKTVGSGVAKSGGGRRTRRSRSTRKTRKPSKWLDFVKKTHKTCKNRPNWSFSKSLKEAGKRWRSRS